MRKPAIYIYKKTQISCAVIKQVIRAFIFATYIYSKYNPNPKFNIKNLAVLCGCISRFVSNLVGNPKTGFDVKLLIKLHFYCSVPYHWGA